MVPQKFLEKLKHYFNKFLIITYYWKSWWEMRLFSRYRITGQSGCRLVSPATSLICRRYRKMCQHHLPPQLEPLRTMNASTLKQRISDKRFFDTRWGRMRAVHCRNWCRDAINFKRNCPALGRPVCEHYSERGIFLRPFVALLLSRTLWKFLLTPDCFEFIGIIPCNSYIL